MNKRVEGKDRLGEGGPQDGPTGTGYHRKEEGEERPEMRRDLGVGGQRHPGGSSRDPASQGRRTKEEARG